MSNPLVSICIPTYNGEKHIEQCLVSATNQTYKNIEIIIIDDASTDNTWNIINQYAVTDKRIKLYRNDNNIGLVGNFNKCLEIAGGQWIKFLLQDDYITDNCVDTMVANISVEDKIVSCKRTFLLDGTFNEDKKGYYNHGVVTFEGLGIISKAPIFIKPNQIAKMAIENICMNFIGEPTSLMIKRDVLVEMGYFNIYLAQICDLEYFLRISSRYGIKYIPESLTYFRIHTESTTEVNLQSKTYVLSHLDPIIFANQLLFDKCYSSLRNNLNFIQKIKLKLYFLVRVYEAYKSAAGNSAEVGKFESVSEMFPEIKKHQNGSLFTKFLFAVIKIKRRAKN